MTQDEIIEMARQAGIPSANVPSLAFGRVETGIELLEAFAKLVAEKAAAKEREACAELRNKFHPFDAKGRQEIIDVMNTALDDYQAAIRARGQA